MLFYPFTSDVMQIIRRYNTHKKTGDNLVMDYNWTLMSHGLVDFLSALNISTF